MNSTKYILLTAARNEEDFIEKTIESIIMQSIKPKHWIIISDGSTDKTEEIVISYAERFDFITLHKVSGDQSRNFGSKAKAIMYAYSLIQNNDFKYVGNIDADISLNSTYYENLLKKFKDDEKLGIGGGFRYDYCNGKFRLVRCALNSVGGPFQFFRKECFEEIGGYKTLKYGGIDALAEVTARMLNWKVQSFTDLLVFHHRCTGSARGGLIKSQIIEGKKYYNLGYDYFFFLLKMTRKIFSYPFLIGYLLNLFGFFQLALKGEKRDVELKIIKYLRREQRNRIFPFDVQKFGNPSILTLRRKK